MERQDAVRLGKKLLDNQMESLDSTFESVPEAVVESLLEESSLRDVDHLFEEIGTGNKTAYMVARRLLHLTSEELKAEHSSLTIQGTDGLLITYAKCCRPIPGDPIVGVMSKGKGMVVHTEQCRNIVELRNDPDRCLHLHWDKAMEGEFQVEIRVDLRNARGVLASVANAVSHADANIESIQMQDVDASNTRMSLVVAVSGRKHLSRVIKRLHALPTVSKIERI